MHKYRVLHNSCVLASCAHIRRMRFFLTYRSQVRDSLLIEVEGHRRLRAIHRRAQARPETRATLAQRVKLHHGMHMKRAMESYVSGIENIRALHESIAQRVKLHSMHMTRAMESYVGNGWKIHRRSTTSSCRKTSLSTREADMYFKRPRQKHAGIPRAQVRNKTAFQRI